MTFLLDSRLRGNDEAFTAFETREWRRSFLDSRLRGNDEAFVPVATREFGGVVARLDLRSRAWPGQINLFCGLRLFCALPAHAKKR
ncbi:MAG TPA: hypothetical protein VFE24_02965 [Pirellulales bacterium]|jgi:hypothetical protein|nr:hypothetical protein [Pirellulales bacterium]